MKNLKGAMPWITGGMWESIRDGCGFDSVWEAAEQSINNSVVNSVRNPVTFTVRDATGE